MVVIVFKPDCEYPRWIAAVFLPQNLFMLILFIDFYIKAYIRKPKQLEKDLKEQKCNGHSTDDRSINTHKLNGSLRENNKNYKEKAH